MGWWRERARRRCGRSGVHGRDRSPSTKDGARLDSASDDRLRRPAAVAEAIEHAGPTVPGARQLESWMRGRQALDFRDAGGMSRLVLGNRLAPPHDPEQLRRAWQPQLAADEIDQRLVRLRRAVGVARTADKRREEDPSVGRALRPEGGGE